MQNKASVTTSAFIPRPGCKYIAFFKPFEVLTQFTKEPNSDKRTFAEFDFPKNVYPIGRLDYDSEGLILLSDDSRLNSALLDPKHAHHRIYLAQVERIPAAEEVRRLETGVLIEGRKTLPAKAELLLAEPALPERSKPIRFRKNIPTAWLKLTLTEGKNRQVRKMTAAIGHPTLRLVRIQIGHLSIFNLQLEPGEWRLLSPEEVRKCFERL